MDPNVSPRNGQADRHAPIVTKPFVRLLSGSTKGLLRLMGVKESTGSSVTEAEIHAVLAEGTSAGVMW